jgi:choline transport protein
LAATSFFVSSLLLALVNQTTPSYVIEPWHVTLLFWGVLGISVLTNTLLSGALPFIEIIVLILHIFGFFATLIPLVYLSAHNTTQDVFENFQNGGGWSTMALSFFIGLQGNANAFIGT